MAKTAGFFERFRAPAIARTPAPSYVRPVPALSPRLARARYRAWHRGTREADYMIGGFFDRHFAAWGEDALAWFEALLEEADVDIMAWALGTQQPPESYSGPQLEALKRLDYVVV